MADGPADIENIEGRVIALELMLQGFMAMVAGEQPNLAPVAYLDGWEHQMKASLQNIQRPIGEHEDRVWEEAARGLELLFSNVRKRLTGMTPG